MTDAEKLADKLLSLINSRPRTPTREEMVGLIQSEIDASLKSAQRVNPLMGVVSCKLVAKDDIQAIVNAIRGMQPPSEWRKKG